MTTSISFVTKSALLEMTTKRGALFSGLRSAWRQPPTELVLANKHTWRCPMIRKSVLVLIGVVLFSLSLSNKTAARDLRLPADSPNRLVLMDRADLLKLASRYGLTIRRIKVSPDLKSRLTKLGSKGCGCGLVPDDDDFGSCFKNCLSSWGINQTTVLACGATCTAAGTGNPIGIALCAGCLGVGEWIVAGCALSCTWHPGGGHIGDVLGKNLKHRPSSSGSAQARNLKTRTANVRI